MKLSKSTAKKRYIALPEGKGQRLYFESQKEVKDFFRINYEKFTRALNEGEPLCINDNIYYLDEDLFE